MAETLGLRLTGTLGLLLDAKRASLIPAVGPLLDQLEALRFRMAPQTRAAILKSVPFPIADLLRRVLEGKGLEPLRERPPSRRLVDYGFAGLEDVGLP